MRPGVSRGAAYRHAILGSMRRVTTPRSWPTGTAARFASAHRVARGETKTGTVPSSSATTATSNSRRADGCSSGSEKRQRSLRGGTHGGAGSHLLDLPEIHARGGALAMATDQGAARRGLQRWLRELRSCHAGIQGRSVCGNVLLAHPSCNIAKDNRLPSNEQLAMLVRVNSIFGWNGRFYENTLARQK